MPYFTEASPNVVSHTDRLSYWTVSLHCQRTSGLYVAISKDGLLHGAALVDASGEVDVPVNPVLEGRCGYCGYPTTNHSLHGEDTRCRFGRATTSRLIYTPLRAIMQG